VENAVKHGGREKRSEQYFNQSQKDKRRTGVLVKDDGMAFPQARWRSFYAGYGGKRRGMNNVNERLKHLWR